MACYLFAELRHALECRDYVTSYSLHGENAIASHVICIRSIEMLYAFAQLDVKTNGDSRKDSVLIIHAVFCPVAQSQLLSEYWRLVGTGIPSRLAEYCVKHLTVIQDVTSSMQDTKRPNRWCDPHHRKICQRIVDLVRRGPIPGASEKCWLGAMCTCFRQGCP